MATATHSVTIHRPPAEVYRFLADGLNNPKWRSSVVEISLASGTAGEAGAVYKQTVNGPMGKVEGDYRLVTAIPDSKIAFAVITGPARPEGVFELSPVEGGTKVVFTLSFQPTGLMRMMGPLIQSTMNGEVQKLAVLKTVLEGGPAA